MDDRLKTAPYQKSIWSTNGASIQTRQHLQEVDSAILSIIKAKGGVQNMPMETFLPVTVGISSSSSSTDNSTVQTDYETENKEMMKALGYIVD